MIGEFARRCRLPVSTLRYYDRIGLLVPADVDAGSGYRRYRMDQLPTAVRIAQLRDIGVAPEHMAEIVAGGPAATDVLLRERSRIAENIEAGRRRLHRIDELLREPVMPSYEVRFGELAAQRIAVRHFSLLSAGIEAGVTRAITGLRAALRRSGRERVGPWAATFPVEIEDPVRGFAFAAIAAIADGDADELETTWIDGGPAVSIEHAGSPAALPLAYAAAFAALDEMAVTPIGPVIEEYPGLDRTAAGSPAIRLWMPYRG